MKRFLLILTLLAALTLPASAAINTATGIFDPYFRSLHLYNPADVTAAPVITLHGSNYLVLSFDELGDNRSYLRYRLVHCNADWKPSQLVDTEYVDSFNEARIEDYGFSNNTYAHYVNYRVEIPNPDLTPTLPGNYLVQVYDEDDPDTVLLQARFMVVDPEVDLTGGVTSRTDRGFNDSWQQLNLNVNLKDEQKIRNPYDDLIVVIERNGEPENRRVITHPLRMSGKTLIYEHQPELIFPAGNEYRRFETVRTTYPGMHADSVRFEGSNYHAYLMVDEERASKGYLFDQTQFGNFVVDEYNSTDPDLGADYVTVHFTLQFPEILDADIYVDGDFSHRSLGEAYKMDYDRDTWTYTLSLPLKQGSYNYRYVVVPRHGGGAPTSAPVEGDKYETRNSYNIYIYHRPPGARYDRLIGTGRIIS